MSELRLFRRPLSAAQISHSEFGHAGIEEAVSSTHPALAHLSQVAQAKMEGALERTRYKRACVEGGCRETVDALSDRRDKLQADITRLHRLLDLTASCVASKVPRACLLSEHHCTSHLRHPPPLASLPCANRAHERQVERGQAAARALALRQAEELDRHEDRLLGLLKHHQAPERKQERDQQGARQSESMWNEESDIMCEEQREKMAQTEAELDALGVMLASLVHTVTGAHCACMRNQ